MPDQPPSASLEQPTYWWYRARAALLESVLTPHLPAHPAVLDVGSADGPSVGWLKAAAARRVPLDVDPSGLTPGGVCGSALALPFRDRTFDVVGAFDVLEHCAPELVALAEFRRVLRPGGRLLLAVPAYRWAWTQFDVDAGHHRRYTRGSLVRALEAADFEVRRATYVFASTLPLFAGERAIRKVRDRRGASTHVLTPVPGWADRLLTRLCRAEARVVRRRDLPFGSSLVVAATRR